MIRFFALFGLTLALVAVSWAGPLEDAQKALDEKKYEEVDKALAKVLSQKNAPPEALKISLQAALASGRMITANARITALLKATQNQDLDLVYQGGVIANQAGDERAALSRFLFYAKAKNEKSDKLEYALRYALTRAASAEEYKKYLTLFGPTSIAWDLGLRVLATQIENSEAVA
ncbi:MAG: hypothetical protein N3A66_01420, partial [Planctomycetota bacterium]|nr:hypothetical protein [Planctomycetota bacterium]